MSCACINLDDVVSKSLQLDLSQYNPYEVSGFVFVRSNHIMGVVSYGQMVELDGLVIVDFLMRSPIETAPFVEPPPYPVKEPVLWCGSFFSELPVGSAAPTLDELWCYSFYQGRYNYECSMVMGIISMCMRKLDVPFEHVHPIAQRFEHFRLERERRLLDEWFADASEESIYHMMLYNDYPPEYIVEGTILDFQCAYNRGLWKPTRFYMAPVWEIALKGVPMHKGATLHLHSLDVKEWIWTRCLTRWRDAATRIWSMPREQLFAQNPHLRVVGRAIYLHYYLNVPPPKHSHGVSSVKKTKPSVMLPPNIGPELFPPCLRKAVSRWPKNAERKQIVPAMRRAGYAIEDLDRLFTSLHNGGNSLRDFDHRYYFNNGYGGKNCRSLIEQHASTEQYIIKCPFSSDELEAKTQCCEQIDIAWAHPTSLYSPATYMKWAATKHGQRITIEEEQEEDYEDYEEDSVY